MSISETLKKAAWNKLSSYEKHIILMYMYRIETDIEHIEDYLETARFRTIGVEIKDLPMVIRSESPAKLKARAYEAIRVSPPK